MRRLVLGLLSVCALLAATALDGHAATTPNGTLIPVDTNTGDQTDSHVDGSLIVYTSQPSLGTSVIKYLDLNTRQYGQVPNDGSVLDDLSHSSGGRIVFTRWSSSGTSNVGIFDTTASSPSVQIVDPVSTGVTRFGPMIGGNNIAWVESVQSTTNSQIMVYSLITGMTKQLSTVPFNDVPAISQDGNVVTWEGCASSALSGYGCNIFDAVQTNGAWVVHQLTTDDSEGSPSTNGQLVVYARALPGTVAPGNGQGEEIAYQPATGGLEQTIRTSASSISDEWPRINGNYISFQERDAAAASPTWQIRVAEMKNGSFDGNIYAMPASQADQFLDDLGMTASGTLNVTWTQSNVDYDIYAFSFSPESPQQQISTLGATIKSWGLPHGLQTSLLAKLNAAQADYQAGNISLACTDLQDLISQATAQSGKALTVDQANYIVTAASEIRQTLGC